MAAQVITSKDNKFIKKCIKLNNSSRERKKEGLFVLEGLRLCLDAMASGVAIKELAISDSAREKYADSINTLEEYAEKLYYVSNGVFKAMSDTLSPQGVIGVAEFPEIKKSIDPSGKYIALENIQDPSNLGAVSRSAEAFGISGLIVSGDSVDPFSPKALRASMGALLRIPVIIVNDVIEFLKENSLRSVACVVDADAKKITDTDFSGGVAAIIGNEGNGLKAQTIQSADECITIQMSGRAESLNAAVAASIVIWEMQR